jgi:hypothetical protein
MKTPKAFESTVSRRSFLGGSSALLAGTLAPLEAAGAAAAAGAGNQSQHPEPGMIAYSANGLDISISERTGCITRLGYAGVGTLLSASEEAAGILTVGLPVPKFAPFAVEPRLSRASVTRDGTSLVIDWERLTGNRTLDVPTGHVSARVRISPAPDGRSVILQAHVENHSGTAVAQLLFPDLWGLRPIDDPRLMELRMALGVVNPLAGPLYSRERAPFYAPPLWQEYPSEGQYQRNALRWMDYGSLRGGFSLFEKRWMTEPRPSLMTHRNESDPHELRLALRHRSHIAPGASWDSPEYWLTPHTGGWAKGIEPFREYVRKTNPPRSVAVPERIRKALGFQTIWMIQSAECDGAHAAFRFTDLERVARDAHAHGIDELVLWGWCHYGTLPIRVREELGTPEEFLAGVRAAAAVGVNVTPFVSIKQLDDSFASRYGVKPGTSASWTFHPELIPAMYPFDTPSGRIDIATSNRIWQGDVLSALDEWVKRGITSFAWDVFDDGNEMGLIELIRQVRARVGGTDGSFAGEPYMGTHERAAQVLDYTWCWNDYLECTPYTSALRYPRINANVERSARAVKMAFADGLIINAMPKRPNQPNGSKLLGEEPELSAALKEVAPLRTRFLEYFTSADPLGDSFLARQVAPFVRKQRASLIGGATDDMGEVEYPPVMVRGYRNGDTLLVVVLNNDTQPRDVTLESDLAAWLPGVRACNVAHYDGRGQLVRESRWSAGAHWLAGLGELPSLGLAFIELRTV